MREQVKSHSFLLLLMFAKFGNVSSQGFEFLGSGQRPIANKDGASNEDLSLRLDGGPSISSGGEGIGSDRIGWTSGVGETGGIGGTGESGGIGGFGEEIQGLGVNMNSGMTPGGSWGNIQGLGGLSDGGSGAGSIGGTADGSGGGLGGGIGGGRGGQDFGWIQGDGGPGGARTPVIFTNGGESGGATSSGTSTSTSTSVTGGGGGGPGSGRGTSTENSKESSEETPTGGRESGRRRNLMVTLVRRRGSSSGGGLLSSGGLLGGALGAASTGALLGPILAARRGASRIGRRGGTRVIRIIRRGGGGCRICPLRRSARSRRSIKDDLSPSQSKIAHELADSVPDHVKVIRCGRHEMANPGGVKDHFCHPEATWATLLRMRPDCVCKPGYLRNSWGECISLPECMHCSDKHHLNMDYHLCESQCPVVCNQPINNNCPNTCYKECACRPGYIRAFPHGPCVSIKKCLPGCPSANQVFTLCGSLCPPTCANPSPRRCAKVCAGEGCVCKPGYVIRQYEPLVCVRPEQCRLPQKKCLGRNQVYTTCKSRCLATCWDREPRFCTADCAGSGCVCKPGFVIRQRKPLVCVRRNQCPQLNFGPFLQTRSPRPFSPRF
ncbi:hypothetical protein V5799_034213 [Amblyomma americanum]|uniref:TIL domain-containing protein n=1 Tax=Amblyomma americanum TaxID=6943 RepID=A0AAQ4DL32_AMBAM